MKSYEPELYEIMKETTGGKIPERVFFNKGLQIETLTRRTKQEGGHRTQINTPEGYLQAFRDERMIGQSQTIDTEA